jgi:phosphate transport system substrate-binding protein
LLKVDGIYPDRDTIKNKQYPLVTEFYAVTAGSKNRNVDSLIQWILSPQGQKIIEKTGYTPIK